MRQEYQDSTDKTFFQKEPGSRNLDKGKALVQPARYKEVMQYKCKPVNPACNELQHQDLESRCEGLAGAFPKNDIHSLSVKAKQLVAENAVRAGFEPRNFFIKSSSKPSPHIVKGSPSGKFSCDSDCLGYQNRNICSHVVAVAFNQKKLPQLLSHFPRASATL